MGLTSGIEQVAFLLDSDTNAVSAHLTIRYPLIDMERNGVGPSSGVTSTAVALASALRRDATAILSAVPVLDAPEYTTDWVSVLWRLV
jgi:hypothetical protein